jgi:hypothetical protein
MVQRQAQPTMTPEAILEHLRTTGGHFPRAAMLGAIAQQEAITPHLLDVLQSVARDPTPFLNDDDDFRPSAALYLLAQFRETRACQALADVFALEDRAFDHLFGDTATERGQVILAAICGEDPAVLQAIFENPNANTYARSAALRALVTLVLHDRWPRDAAVEYLRLLLKERLPREPSHEWSVTVAAAVTLHPGALLEEIR